MTPTDRPRPNRDAAANNRNIEGQATAQGPGIVSKTQQDLVAIAQYLRTERSTLDPFDRLYSLRCVSLSHPILRATCRRRRVSNLSAGQNIQDPTRTCHFRLCDRVREQNGLPEPAPLTTRLLITVGVSSYLGVFLSRCVFLSRTLAMLDLLFVSALTLISRIQQDPGTIATVIKNSTAYLRLFREYNDPPWLSQVVPSAPPHPQRPIDNSRSSIKSPTRVQHSRSMSSVSNARRSTPNVQHFLTYITTTALSHDRIAALPSKICSPHSTST
jgi:hypothetical protein